MEGAQSLGWLPEVPPSLHCLSVVAAEFLSVSICKMGLITVPSQRPGESWDECLTRGGGLWCGVPAGRWVALLWKLTCCLLLTGVLTRPSLACGQSECCTVMITPEADGPAQPRLTGLWAWLLGSRAAVLWAQCGSGSVNPHGNQVWAGQGMQG